MEDRPSLKSLALHSLGISSFFLGGMWFWHKYDNSNRMIARTKNGHIQIGEMDAATVLVADPSVLGGEYFGREIRAAIREIGGGVSLEIVDSTDTLSASDERPLILSGRSCTRLDETFLNSPKRRKSVVFLSPVDFPLDVFPFLSAGRTAFVIGELSDTYSLIDEEQWKVVIIPGAALYLPDWMGILHSLGMFSSKALPPAEKWGKRVSW